MIRFLSLLIFIALFISVAAQKPAVTAADKNKLLGEWKGSLTYLDYTTQKPFSMPAELNITKLGKNQLVFFTRYPKEPKANGSDTITFSKEGRMIDNETVQSRKKLADGTIEIISTYSGVDGNDNKKALIRLTYVIGDSVFIKRKEVRFEGTKEWIKRHKYSYARK